MSQARERSWDSASASSHSSKSLRIHTFAWVLSASGEVCGVRAIGLNEG